MHEYGISLTKLEDVSDVDCVILAVAHDEFRKLSIDALGKALQGRIRKGPY
jgi:UDP-N-acetyl-D-galactosamine dehydrogenase